MKKGILLFVIIFAVFIARAQEPQNVRSFMQLDVNEIGEADVDRINSYINEQQKSRGLLTYAASSLASLLDINTIKMVAKESVRMVKYRSIKRDKWKDMIKNECYYFENINYVNNLNDFYSEGSFDGPLDPENLKFNGFTLITQNNGKDVMKFYCHIATDEEGMDFIFNHSKFRLVVDSLYFYPYNCHLPNMLANDIYVKNGNKYVRNTSFSFEDRENLVVGIKFVFSASWYNEAIMLAKDVELGTFDVQIPIAEDRVVDSVFIYKKGMPGVEPISITGDCYLVPRSYMPLPGGVSRWGTGEYNVKAEVSESCTVTKQFKKRWSDDYRIMKRMRRNKNKVDAYYVDKYEQKGNKVEKRVIETPVSQ